MGFRLLPQLYYAIEKRPNPNRKAKEVSTMLEPKKFTH
ncbi:hypothetical protein C7475_11925 [Chitinophaga sp. S165]|nr:hypothetical protein C7475_11925 [Chitinophaga sp. S165]